MNNNSNLTLEQQFNIRWFEQQVKQMSREQAQEFLVKLYHEMVVKENFYQEMIKKQWGIK